MSTILDALKKVENERDTVTSAEQQRQLDALQSINRGRRQKHGATLIKWGAMAAVLCLLGGTAFIFYNRAQMSTERVQVRSKITRNNEPAAPASVEIAKAAPAKSRQTRSKKNPPIVKPATSNKKPPSLSRAPTIGKAPDATDKHVISTSPPKLAQAPVVNPALERQVASQPPPPMQAKRPAPSPRPQVRASKPAQQAWTPPVSTPKRAYERLADSSLKVQAIAWSPTREESMAVINSKIVREGNSVDDYDVVAIDQEEVVVRKGGQMWRVIFGRP